jgi:multiphosphoryl transfer protein
VVGIVIVSHSAGLAEGVVELASQMAGPDVVIVAAGGLDQPDHPLGTDAALILSAIELAWNDDGVLVLMDLGSAVLSAELAVDMLPDSQRSGVLLCEAPVVEGAVAAAVAARLGEPLAQVADEARGGLAGKAAQLGVAVGSAGGPPAPVAAPADSRALELRLTVTNPLGLHARPAAKFVQTAGRFDATVSAENLTVPAGPASARSLNGVATLGVRQGHEVLVRAAGPQAAEAIAALRELAERNFGEPAQPAAAGGVLAGPAAAGGVLAGPAAAGGVLAGPGAVAAGPAAAGTVLAGPGGVLAGPAAAGGVLAGPAAAGTVLHGIPGSPGTAVGSVVHLRSARIEVPREPAGDPAAELARLAAALDATSKDVRAARESVAARTGGGYEADIFDAHLLFLDDEALLGPARQRIREGRNAADAWDGAVTEVAQEWQHLTDPYQRERAADLDSIRIQVLGHLLDAGAVELTGQGVVVAAELTPAQTAGLDTAAVSGIATAYGGPTSHAAILARALRIPAALGLGPAVLEVAAGTEVLLNGDQGSLRVGPTQAERAAAEQERRASLQTAVRAQEAASEPAVTSDGTNVEVAANAASVQDVRRAVAAGADGIGLLRTEFVFLSAERMPTEDEQAGLYAEIAAILAGRPLIVRTLDVGADKQLPYLPVPAEPNPQLGQRGIRLGLARTELLVTQVRAVLRVAASHPVKLMFPMVATQAEVRTALDLVSGARHALAAEGVPVPADGAMETGIMIEVPAAALTARSLAAEVDFFSVGTNDLTQYTMAADREVSSVAGLSDALHPAVLTLIGRAAAAATDAGRWIGVCGELAADPVAVPLLLGLGVRELSVNVAAVGTVKQAVRSTDVTKAAALAAQALELPSAAAVRGLVRRAVDGA